MPNIYFQFKQFTVHQNKSAMKVCTDACIFGAWVSKKIGDFKLPVYDCLDVGTGTGLLSLMLVQKNTDIRIEAVEIEKNAFEQAKENFANSPWPQRLKAIHADIKDFTSSIKYDFIITNPPFFENDLLPLGANKKLAKHEDLNLEMLINSTLKNLKRDGYFAILLPFHRIHYFEKLAEKNNVFINSKLLIRQTPLHSFFRGILICGVTPAVSIEEELIIKKKNDEYTDDFIRLLKDYYLHL